MKVNGFWKKTLCFVLAMAMVLGNASPVVAAHEHETAAEIVTEITNATIKEAEKLINKTGLMNAADATDTKNSLEEADSNLAGSMDNLGTAVEDAQAAIDELEGKVTKDDATEINASLSVAYNEANRAWEEAVAVSDAAVADLKKAAAAHAAASKISDEAAKVAEAELKAAQEALNAAVEATKFANDNMVSLKNEFAKATELATKWSTEVETALAEATAKFEEAQAALNSALEALESGDAELKAAIDTFKACYDAFITAANTFKTSIQTAIDAQDNLEALFAEYEAAQAAYAEALAAYEAKCAEHEAAGLLNTYDGYTEALKTLNVDLEKLEEDLEKAEGIEAGAKAAWEAALWGTDYLAMKDLTDTLAKVPETDEEKAAVENAAYEAAVYIIEKKLANGGTVIKVDAEGNNADGVPTYGKASEEYFAVLNEKGEAVSRYDYKLNYDENGKGVVNIYEMVPTEDVTNYVNYNGDVKELHLVADTDNQYYIEVGSDKIELVKNENNEYIETLVAEQTFAENPADIPTEVNAAGLYEYVIDNTIIPMVNSLLHMNIELSLLENEKGYYIEILGFPIPVTLNVALEKDNDNNYYVTLFRGATLKIDFLNINISFETKVPVEVTKKADNSGYDVKHVYYVDMLYTEEQLDAGSECVNGAHTTSGYGHANVVECNVPLHVRYNNHATSFDAGCISHNTQEECAAAECNSALHATSELHGEGNVNKIVGKCTKHSDKKIFGIGYNAHKYENGVIYGLKGLNGLSPIWEVATCGVQLNGPCSTCSAGTVAISCTGGTFGFCNTEPRYINVHGTVFPETLPQAVYEGKEYTVQGSTLTGLYIEIPAAVEGEAATRIDLAFVDVQSETEADYYTYEVKHAFVQGGAADTVFALSETALGVDSNVYEKEVLSLENTYLECGKECDRIEGLIAGKEEEITVFKAAYADFVSAYNTMVATEAVATEKELGELADLPKNIGELVEGLSGEELSALLEAIIELSSNGETVDFNAILKVLKTVISETTAGRLIYVLADDVTNGWGSIIGGIIGGITGNEKPVPPTKFERTYANAWVNALTTKINVVQNAIKLVETAVATVEAGVTAVTEGIELAEVAVDAVLATAEKKLLEATVEVLVMANDVMNSSEEIVLSIDNIIAEAQARTEKAYLVAVAESNALNQVTITRPYATKLDETLVTIGAANALNAELTADIALAEVSIATAKVLYEELKALEEHEHQYLSKITEATCTEDGSIVYVCTICTHTYTEVLDATGHAYESEVTAPSCTEAGYTTYTCSRGDHSYVADYVDALGHSFGEWTVEENATCTETGKEARICATCGEEETRVIDALGHDYDSVVTNPTCTAGGHTTHTCKACGDSYVDAETEVLAHAYVTERVEATCETDGHVVYECTGCDDTYTVVLEAFGHNYQETDSKPATCTANGYTNYACANCRDIKSEVHVATGHAYDEVVTAPTCEAAGYTTYTCKTCGDNYKANEVEALGHNYVLTDSKPATCTADGMNAYTCENCRDKKSEVVSKKGHAYEAVVTAPTCTREGYTTHTCTVCKDTYTDSKVAATGHKYELTDSKPATCLADGSNIYTCTGCKDVKREVLAATGHDYKAVVTEPTCTAGGYTTHTCNNCGDVYTDTEVEALGHKFESVVTNPTCTEKGYTTYTCSACKASYKDDEVAANGHTWGEWEVTVDPTEETFGEKVRKCTVDGCKAQEVEKINPLPHTHVWNDGVVKLATCTEGGYTTYTCTKCNEEKVENKVPALNHNYVATETAPTCTADGYFTHVCSRCGDNYKTEGAKATGHTWGAWEVTTPAEEGVPGEATRTCHCGATDTQVVPALGHSYEAVVTAPTCTEKGYTTYTCECGDSYVADYVDALGHKETSVVTAPTCEATGYTTYTCTVCNVSRTADTTTALGHDYVPTITAPKCEAEGYTTYDCSRCDANYVADYVNAAGHSYGEWTVEKPATCTEEGTEAQICAACGKKETRAIEATGHSFGEWTVAEDATCTEEGTEVRACEVCDAEESRAIKALGHSYTSVVTAPTCTAKGYTTYTCACGDAYVADEVAAKGHSYEVEVTEATCTVGGHTTYVCACGSYETGDETEALGHTWGAWTVTTAATETATGVETRECATCHATETNTLAMLTATPVAGDNTGNEVEIDDEETPLAGGEVEDEVIIEDEEPPLASGEIKVEVVASEEVVAKAEEQVNALVEQIVAGETVSETAVSEETVAKITEAIESGEEIIVKVIAEVIEETAVPEEEKAQVKETADELVEINVEDVVIVQFVDLAVEIYTSSGEKLGNYNELSETLTFTVNIPEGIDTEGKTFVIIRVHNGEVTILDTVMNEDGTLSFETDKFSTYAIAYREFVNKVNIEEVEIPLTNGNSNFGLIFALVGALAVIGTGVVVSVSQRKKSSSR